MTAYKQTSVMMTIYLIRISVYIIYAINASSFSCIFSNNTESIISFIFQFFSIYIFAITHSLLKYVCYFFKHGLYVI